MDVWFNGKVIQLLHTTQYMEAAVCVCVCVCVCDWVSEWVSQNSCDSPSLCLRPACQRYFAAQ